MRLRAALGQFCQFCFFLKYHYDEYPSLQFIGMYLSILHSKRTSLTVCRCWGDKDELVVSSQGDGLISRNVSRWSCNCCCVAHYHKPGGLNPHGFILLQFQKPEITNQFHKAKVKAPSGGYGENPFPCFS